MKHRLAIVFGVVAAIALVAFAAMRGTRVASSPAPPAAATAAPPAEVPRIEPQALNALLVRGEVTLLDVRDADSYIAGHIPGALQIPLSRVEGEIPYFPRGKPIVAYCT